MSSDPLECLVGEELNIVAFVMDYVEFHFNGPILRAISNPVVEHAGRRVRFPDTGSRDALCALIGTEVLAVEERDHDRIELRTTGGHVLTIPLDDASYRGAEAAHFVPADDRGRLQAGGMIIW
jgi:hypothetical protein